MSGSGNLPRFSESAPRPPVFPGEENARNSLKIKTMESQLASSRITSHAHSRRSLPHNLPIGSSSPKGSSSPLATPRRGHFYQSCHEDSDAIRRYEAAEGSASTSPPLTDTPPYLRWAENLRYLLNDSEGIDLFKKYLTQENALDLLTFWFACEGMKRKTPEEDRERIIKVIHRKYIRSKKIPISEAVRKDLADRVAAKIDLSVHIFDAAQKEVENLMQETAYPNFLRSDVYLSYIQTMQSHGEAPDSPRSGQGIVKPPAETVSTSSLETADRVNTFGALATVPEDGELVPAGGGENPATLPLTPSALLATQTRRATMHLDSRPKPEYSASSMYLHGVNSRVPHPYHATAYVPYNPVSRQDSELQSLSSDAQTDDTRSLTDSSVDGMSIAFGGRLDKSRMKRWHRKQKENAAVNRDPALHQTFIPRTQRLPKEQQNMPQNPEEFASILIHKLELVKRERDNDEKFSRKILERGEFSEGEGLGPITSHSRLPGIRQGPECSARVLVEALQKLGVSNESDTQSILDAHVQRIWSDQTPLRSPGVPSPRPWSPETKRKTQGLSSLAGSKGANLQQLQQQQQQPIGGYPMAPPPAGGAYANRPVNPVHFRRKEKDAASVFSTDSGAVIDHAESGSEPRGIPKSRSMPEGRRIGAVGLGFGPKKGDLADSGLSLVSDTPTGTLFAPPANANSKEKVMSWIMESDKYHEDREGTSKHSLRAASTTSPVSSRRSRKAGQVAGSRSESAERLGVNPNPLGTVPVEVAVIDDQLRAARPPTRPKPSLPCSSSSTLLQQQQQLATLKKHRSSLPPTSSNEGSMAPVASDFVVVTFTFGDEAVPYRSKIAGKAVTLKQFKDILPKKGIYRYYFKTTCEDDVSMAVHQEVMDDNEILPLWEGKVFGLVKHVD